jgi:hypothetical protein
MNILLAIGYFCLLPHPSAEPLSTEPGDTGKPHPQAPAEISQFAFVTGQWKLDAWFLEADGTKRVSQATLSARFTLDGFGIRMENRYPQETGPDFVGVNTFVFNPRVSKWIGSGINSLGNRKDFEGGLENGQMVFLQTGMQFGGRPGINRITFFPISENQFKLRYDYSPDNGQTWREGTFGYTATRAPSKR